MAQVNITHITEIDEDEAVIVAQTAHKVVASVVYGLTGEVEARMVTVLTFRANPAACISGVDTEVQVLISGNDWPLHDDGTPFDYKQAKVYFDDMARRIFVRLADATNRRLYVWVTPYVASGWAE